MTISLPDPSKIGLMGLLGKRRRDEIKLTAAPRPLKPHEIAKRFAKSGQPEQAKPARLSDAEKSDRARLSNLRGALYSKD
ncbi:hypothetical protein [Yoonia sp.]|uniref:hypothetical protein n=1 Tax=Yoonia sp. TaxID=2212373 RepID=UPI0019F76BBA|nr:hypothetical protein [Yoonia sp.]MBE0413928.1 hypothetical protein [Yoonia sp.]